MIYILTQYPEVVEKLRKEIDPLMGNAELNYYEEIPKLKYLDCVVKETQRIYSVAGSCIA